MERKRVFSRAPWERIVGYCRAIQAGSQIYVTGTAPVGANGGVHAPGDAGAQTARCLEIIEEALRGLGTDRRAIVRTRMFVTDISRGRSTAAHTKPYSATRCRRRRWCRWRG